MDVTIEDNETLDKICKDANLTPAKLFEGFIASVTFLHNVYEQARTEGAESRSFDQILSKLYQQILECTPNNLDVAPSLIEQTNKLVGIKQSFGAEIYNFNIDYDNRTVSYNIHYTFCTDTAQVFAYSNLALGIRITPKYIQISHLDYIPLLDDLKIYNANLEILNDFVNQKLLRKYNNKSKDAQKAEPDPSISFIQISCTLRLVGSNPYQLWDKTRSQSHEFFLIRIDVKADKVAHLLPIEEMVTIHREIRGIGNNEMYPCIRVVKLMELARSAWN